MRQNKPTEGDNRKATTKQESSASRSIEEIKNINERWKKQIEELDDLGVQINKTLIGLVKIYSEEEVKNAISRSEALRDRFTKIQEERKIYTQYGGIFYCCIERRMEL